MRNDYQASCTIESSLRARTEDCLQFAESSQIHDILSCLLVLFEVAGRNIDLCRSRRRYQYDDIAMKRVLHDFNKASSDPCHNCARAVVKHPMLRTGYLMLPTRRWQSGRMD